MTNGTIPDAIRAYVTHVRKFADISVWDIMQLPTPEEEARRKAQVLALCSEIDVLASREDVEFRDFEALRNKLHQLGSGASPLTTIQAVAQAFFAAGRL